MLVLFFSCLLYSYSADIFFFGTMSLKCNEMLGVEVCSMVSKEVYEIGLPDVFVRLTLLSISRHCGVVDGFDIACYTHAMVGGGTSIFSRFCDLFGYLLFVHLCMAHGMIQKFDRMNKEEEIFDMQHRYDFKKARQCFANHVFHSILHCLRFDPETLSPNDWYDTARLLIKNDRALLFRFFDNLWTESLKLLGTIVPVVAHSIGFEIDARWEYFNNYYTMRGEFKTSDHWIAKMVQRAPPMFRRRHVNHTDDLSVHSDSKIEHIDENMEGQSSSSTIPPPPSDTGERHEA